MTWQVGPSTATGARVVAATDGNDTVLWDLASGRRRFRLRGHTESPLRATFSADGSVLLTQADDGRVIAWNVGTGRPLRTATTARDRFASVAVSRDNSIMAVVADDTLALWSLRNARPPRRLTGIDFQHVAFTDRDAQLVVSARRGEMQLFDEPLDAEQVPRLPPSRTLYGAGDVPQAMAVSATGSRIAQLSSDGTVHVWDLTDTAVVRPYTIAMDSVSQIVTLGADGRFAVGMNDTVLTVWDVPGSRAVGRATFRRASSQLLPADFSIDIGAAGRLVAGPARESGGRGPRDVFDVTTGRLVRSVDVSPDAVVAIDPARARVAYGIRGTHAAVLLDLAQPGRADTLDPGSMPRYQLDSSYAPIVAFSPRGDLLIVQSAQGSILVWDLATRQLRDSLTGTAFYSSQLIASEDGSTVAAVGIDATSFWRKGQSAVFSRYRGTTPNAIALSPDGSLFAFADHGIVTLADVARGEPLGQLETGHERVSHLAFVDSGRALIVVDELGNGVRIATSPDAWMDRACSVASSAEAIDRWVDDAPAASRPPQWCSALTAARR